ncbi:MAG: hypothetical protein RIC16_14995 [Rhodospirillales bacterium]
MARTRIHKTNFTAGEIAPDLLGRADLRAYENGAAKLRNVFVQPTGGLRRRPGLRYLATLPGPGRLVAFEFNTEQAYVLAFTDALMTVFRDGVEVASVAAPWSQAQIVGINWVQSADTLLVVHPDVAPRRITRTGDTAWTIAAWTYVTVADRILQPHHKFADDDVTLTPSATSGAITVTASADHFTADHVGTRLRIEDREIEITGHTSATQASATVKQTLAGTSATADWSEQSFSAARGWPRSVAFHQDRLVVGGSRDLPNRLWLSKSADLYNFDLGEGLDDEAIEFAILSDQVNAITAVFSGRHLQVFTSGAEWMVTGDPLTPETVQINRQTRIGSPVARSVPPRDVDGATLFVQRDGRGLREFLFADVEQAYQANDLATLARHLLGDVVDQDCDPANRLLHLVDADGSLATVTVFRAEQVTAWSRQETDGAFLSLCVSGNDTYTIISRAGGVFLERFDETLATDAALTGGAVPATAVWAGLDHLDGETVKVIADGSVRGDATVANGQIVLDEPASGIEAGLGFAHEIEPLPAVVGSGPGATQGGRLRPVAHSFRLLATAVLRVDAGKGFIDVPFRRLGVGILDTAPQPFTGDKTVRAFGWRRAGVEPLWRIAQDTPRPFMLLAVSSEIAVND